MYELTYKQFKFMPFKFLSLDSKVCHKILIQFFKNHRTHVCTVLFSLTTPTP